MDLDLASRRARGIAEEWRGGRRSRPGEHTAVYLKRLHEAEVDGRETIHQLTQGRPIGKIVIDRAVAAAERAVQITLSDGAAQRASMRAAKQGHRHHRRSRHRQDHAAQFADRGARRCGAEADAGRSDRTRRATASGGHRPRGEDHPSAAGVHAGDAGLPSQRGVSDPHQLPHHRRSLDDGCRARLGAGHALMPNCALLLVGDRDQLPSVGPGSVLKDVIASGLVPVVELREVYRQARESMIVANAHRLNRGEFPDVSNRPEGDFFFFERNAPDDVVADHQAARAAAAGRQIRHHRSARDAGADADESRSARHASAQSASCRRC